MLKRDLRLSHLHLREQLSDSEVLRKSEDVYRQSLYSPVWEYQTYHIFLSIPGKKEVNTAALISHLQQLGKRVVVPKVISGGVLENYVLKSDTVLRKSSWGIPEPVAGEIIAPEKIDVVFVPLLAYDRKGNRVGYGGGFYDRFLARCPPESLVVGLSLFPPAGDITDIESTDLPLDYCINPSGVIKFRRGSG